ncbi:hypothetical protein REMIM1_PE00484 (plasmid) [Rhizobium etli bv. mimosae str. Mim1]|nr:hypothetical protein REMIM1_PE00484 [Rhizobium etli bv. mimosae str. Mim1]
MRATTFSNCDATCVIEEDAWDACIGPAIVTGVVGKNWLCGILISFSNIAQTWPAFRPDRYSQKF